MTDTLRTYKIQVFPPADRMLDKLNAPLIARGMELRPTRGAAHSHASVGEPLYTLCGKADGYVFTPQSRLYDVIAAMDELTLQNPLFCHNSPNPAYDPSAQNGERKPRVIRVEKPFTLLGHATEWSDLRGILTSLKQAGMLRFNLNEYPIYSATPQEAAQRLQEELDRHPRLRHVKHSGHTSMPDILREEGCPPETPRVSVAYFGSASTKDDHYIRAARDMATLNTREGWDMVHGGGFQSVMGALTHAARRADPNFVPHVTGVTVCSQYGAPVIALERVESDNATDHMLYTKDTTIRMQEFCKRSHAVVVMPGGIGTLHELLQVAYDKLEGQSHTKYTDTHGEETSLPIILVNVKNAKQQGLWDGLVAYLRKREPELISGDHPIIQVVDTPEQAHALLKSHFKAHPPSPDIDRSHTIPLHPRIAHHADVGVIAK